MLERLFLIPTLFAVVLLAAAMGGGEARAQGVGQTGGGCNSCSPPPTDCNCETGDNNNNNNNNNHNGRRRRGSSASGSFNTETVTSVVNSVVTTVSGGNGSGNSSSFSGSLFTNSNAFGLGGAVNGSQFVGSGGSSFYVDSPTGYIPNLEVYDASAQSAYQATRTAFRMVAIQAFCLDDKSVPHPASQVAPDRDVAEAFEGELFRCIAGTRMQYTLAAFDGKASFDKGQTVVCNKEEALYHSKGGAIACRRQKPSRDCNERSLLRRFGAGIKVLKMAYTETYTATQASASSSAVVGSMILDGGVGGVVH